MTPEDKALWVNALRSGKFKQGKEYLNRNDRFCCLGVACAIFGGVKVTSNNGWTCYDEHRSTLPFKLQSRLGIDGFGILLKVVVFNGVVYYSLMGLNDNKVPFDFIADVIEDQF